MYHLIFAQKQPWICSVTGLNSQESNRNFLFLSVSKLSEVLKLMFCIRLDLIRNTIFWTDDMFPKHNFYTGTFRDPKLENLVKYSGFSSVPYVSTTLAHLKSGPFVFPPLEFYNSLFAGSEIFL